MINCHFQHTQRIPFPLNGLAAIFGSFTGRVFRGQFFNCGPLFTVFFQNTYSAEVSGIFFRNNEILADYTEGSLGVSVYGIQLVP